MATKICKDCDVEKPIEEFCVRHSMCKRCRNQHDRDRYAERKVENIVLYGTARTPKELGKRNGQKAKWRAVNVRLYGTSDTPDGLRRGRKRHVITRSNRRMRALILLDDICTCCGESRPEMLTFDHIHGREGKPRMNPEQVVGEILSMRNPTSKYRVLCWNCNVSLSAFGYCPHNGRPPEEDPANGVRERAKYLRQFKRKHKLEYIDEYGGKCIICGEDRWEFLTVDHVNGNGSRHRKLLGNRSGTVFYAWLKQQGWPKDDYRLLCFNCNCGLINTREVNNHVTTYWIHGDG